MKLPFGKPSFEKLPFKASLTAKGHFDAALKLFKQGFAVDSFEHLSEAVGVLEERLVKARNPAAKVLHKKCLGIVYYKMAEFFKHDFGDSTVRSLHETRYLEFLERAEKEFKDINDTEKLSVVQKELAGFRQKFSGKF